MTLFILPNDILLLIAEATSTERDFNALTRTNRHLYNLLCDMLYKNNIRHFESSALFWGAREGQLATVQRLLELGADVEATQNHCTPLEAASCAGQEEMVRYLLSRGANYGFWRCRPWTPLCAAAVEGHAGVVRILLDRELPPQKKAEVEDGSGPGTRFICRNKQDTLVKAMFLKDPLTGQDPRIEYSIALFMSIASSEDEVCRVLIESGKADLDYKDGGQRTALEWAYSHHRYRTIAALLKHGADPNIAGRRNRTVLHDAAAMGNEQVVKLLLANSTTDANCKDLDNATPLLLAVKANHASTIEILLQRGDIDVNCRDTDCVTPLASALTDRHFPIAKLLVQHPAIDLEAVDATGRTPLFIATLIDDLDMVTQLLKAGARTEARAIDRRTPLMQAVEAGSIKVALRLILGDDDERPLLLRDQNDWGWTPLFFAAANAEWEMVKLLLHLGAEPFHRDAEGNTILLAMIKRARYHSRGSSEERTIRILLQRGVDPNIQDKHERTALSYAVEFRNGPAMAALLDSSGHGHHHHRTNNNEALGTDSGGHPIKLWARSKTEEQFRELGLKSFIPSAWLVGHGIDIEMPGAGAGNSLEQARVRYNEERRRVHESRVAGTPAAVD